MGYWGKIVGGMAGFAFGGPPGLLVGAALGHAADAGYVHLPGMPPRPPPEPSANGSKQQRIAIDIVVLAAKVARCDGPVNRAEIDAFKSTFKVPSEAVRDTGRLFDQARENPELYPAFAQQLGRLLAQEPGSLENILRNLFVLARADGPENRAETNCLRGIHRAFGLDEHAWTRASAAAATPEPDPYDILGISPTAADKDIRDAWRRLMRDFHPDRLSARGAAPAELAAATDKVAAINAAWDRIKRERGL
jgi:DnaJ like chaperone protein